MKRKSDARTIRINRYLLEISNRQRASSAITFISGSRLFFPIIIRALYTIRALRSALYFVFISVSTLHYACQHKKVLPVIHSRIDLAS